MDGVSQMDLYVFLTHEEAFFNWTESALLVIWSCCKEPKVPPIISTLLKARAEKAFESTARGIQAPTGRRGEVGGGVLVDRTAGTVPQCLAGSGEIPLPLSSHLLLPLLPCFLVLFLLTHPLLSAGYCCASKALMGQADSTDK